MNRRDFMVGSTLIGGAAMAGIPLKAQQSEPLPPSSGKRLINDEQAQKVLNESGLDGVICLNPVNVYYLTNTWPIISRMGWEYPAFATYATDPKKPAMLVTSALQLWDIANRRDEVPEIVAYGGPANWQDYINASQEQQSIRPETGSFQFPVNPDVRLTAREKGWVKLIDEHSEKLEPNAEWALVKALKDSGLQKGTVAVADMRIARILKNVGMKDITCVPGDNLMRRIRHVKSPVEIDLMRYAGSQNAEAALATIASIEEGMRFEDIERNFMMETASRGNLMTFIIAGTSIGLLPDEEVRKGKPMLLDAVSSFRGYHGDFARTIVVGEPADDVVARSKANEIGRDAILQILKPGIRYSEIMEAGMAAMTGAGMPKEAVLVNPHSVGLQHTDQPYREDVPFQVGEDIMLEENMVITVDLPYVEIGWGAGHNEDLIRITGDGFEPLNKISDPLIVV